MRGLLPLTSMVLLAGPALAGADPSSGGSRSGGAAGARSRAPSLASPWTSKDLRGGGSSVTSRSSSSNSKISGSNSSSNSNSNSNSNRSGGKIVPRARTHAHAHARLTADYSVGNLAAARLRGGWLGVDLVQEIAKAYLTPGAKNGGGVGADGNKG
ncbi:unnamed protein product, partial [Laminaria digitata]